MTNSNTSEPPLLSGLIPGLVDPSQKLRILRTSTSSLFFAVFDPLTARANVPNRSSPHFDPGKASKRAEAGASSNGKRVVVETDAETGICSWRFVPRARVEDAMPWEEGTWPRLVELCGQLVRMTQDQWDIYKLDPEYDCLVRAPPNLTTITRITKTNGFGFNTTVTPESPTTPKVPSVTMGINTPTTTMEWDSVPENNLPSDGPRRERRYRSKRVRPTFSSGTDRMSVDEDGFSPFSTPRANNTEPHEPHVENEKKRKRSSVRLSAGAKTSHNKASERGDSFIFSDKSTNPFATNEEYDSGPEVPLKKVRTQSPTQGKRKLQQQRMAREKKRKTNMETRFMRRKEALDKAFWKELGIASDELGMHSDGFGVYSNGAGLHTDLNDLADSEEPEDEGSDGQTTGQSEARVEDDEAIRLAKIEESRRKLAELEKDRPLWEANAKIREAREREEEAKRQRAKQKKEEEARQQQEAQAAWRRRNDMWDEHRREMERQARMKDRMGHMFIVAPLGILRWSVGHALQRYVETATSFDATKFTLPSTPLTFASIPWPVSLGSFSIQDIEWDVVEAFFGNVKGLLNPTQFKTLVENSHRRFHPDRWRSRRLLMSVADEAERDLLEVAGSTVAQVLTPLWKQVTGR